METIVIDDGVSDADIEVPPDEPFADLPPRCVRCWHIHWGECTEPEWVTDP